MLAAGPRGRLGACQPARRHDVPHRGFWFDHPHRCRRRQRNAHVRAGNDRYLGVWRHGDAPGRLGANRPPPIAYGGSATHTAGQGTTATSAYGGSAYHAEGSGYTSYTSASGATAYHSPYYGAAYPAYHPPTTVNYLQLRLLQLRWLEHGGGGGRGCRRSVLRRARRSLRRTMRRQHRTPTRPGSRPAAPIRPTPTTPASWRVRLAQRRWRPYPLRAASPWAASTRRSCGLHHAERPWQHLLPLRQHLVPALVWRQRRLLPRRAAALSCAPGRRRLRSRE